MVCGVRCCGDVGVVSNVGGISKVIANNDYIFWSFVPPMPCLDNVCIQAELF